MYLFWSVVDFHVDVVKLDADDVIHEGLKFGWYACGAEVQAG